MALGYSNDYTQQFNTVYNIQLDMSGWDKKMGLVPPFCIMSRKPGLGDEWFKKNQKMLWQLGYIQLTNGKRAAIPEYYWRKLEAENPEKAWRIKQYRQGKAIASLIERNMETDKRYAEQLADKEAVMKKEMSKAKGVFYRDWETDRKSTRLNSSHSAKSRMPSSA